MDYSDLYKEIMDTVRSSIATEDSLLHDKILKHFEIYYDTVYKDRLKRACEENDTVLVASLLQELDKLCDLPDYYKLKTVFQDDTYNAFKNLSSEIFVLAQNFYMGERIKFDDIICKTYTEKIEIFESQVSKLFQDEYKWERSECYLDLEYLKNGGNVPAYSIRLYNFMN